MFIFGNITLSGATPTPPLHSQYSWQQVSTTTYYITVVGEQPYKNRDTVGSDSGLGHLLVIFTVPVQVQFFDTNLVNWH